MEVYMFTHIYHINQPGEAQTHPDVGLQSLYHFIKSKLVCHHYLVCVMSSSRVSMFVSQQPHMPTHHSPVSLTRLPRRI